MILVILAILGLILGAVLLSIWRAVAGYRHRLATAWEAVRSLNPLELEHFLHLVESIGNAESRGFLGLLTTPTQATGKLAITLPDDFPEFPWAGKMVVVGPQSKASASPADMIIEDPKDFQDVVVVRPRWLAVPSLATGPHKQRARSVFSVDRYLKRSPVLRERVTAAYPANPSLFLNLLLSADGSTSAVEPFDQMRCGLSPAWIQNFRAHKCPHCKKPMRLVLQLPGGILGKRSAEGTFYLFGCVYHPDETVRDVDWS